MHECVRKEIMSRLGELGVKQLFVHKEGFGEAKPDGPHVTILATELEALMGKKDVIVVVNEHMQDLGVWAYRMLMREPGIDGGSVVGMVKKLQAWGSERVVSESMADLEAMEQSTRKLKPGGVADEASTSHETPGVIVLNPGELLYSHSLNRNMSQAAWLARPKESAISEAFKIDQLHNRIAGHETSEAHVRSVFEQVIPKITKDDVRLYFVGLSDGSEGMLKCLDDKLLVSRDDHLGSNMEAMALVEPTHVPAQLRSLELSNFMRTARARSYVSSEKRKGELLVMPQSTSSHLEISASQQLELEAGHRSDNSGSETSTVAPIAIPGAKERVDSIEPGLTESTNALRSLGSKLSDSYSFPKSPSVLQSSVHSLPSNDGSVEKSGVLATRSRANTTESHTVPGYDPLADSNGDLSYSKQQEDLELDDDLQPYPYAKDPVSCPTFSAGFEGMSELIWPEVMDSVLDWFRDLSEYADER
ncbi:hypothetical protein LTR53_013004 [Teratosphaeriaceae sp. CCFEE 6253]|nr:hypothetical protein LTR53_013004 [Teratosphaeriaceae sp. CCFEE 6253]